MKTRLISHKALSCLFTFGILWTAQTCLALEANTNVVPSPLTNDLRETTSLVTAIFKVMGSLATVVGLMLLLFFLFKKFGFNKGLSRSGSLIKVIESRLVAPKKYIAIVEIADKCVAVGITDNSITMLTDVDSTFAENSKNSKNHDEAPSFTGLLKKATHSIQNKSGVEGKETRTKEANNA